MLIAAHNEERSIRSTLESLLAQHRRPDRIVVAADNCADATAEIARSVPGVIVFNTFRNGAKKPGALNQAWDRFGRDANLVVCIDADTLLDPNALGDWEDEFRDDPSLGGCSGKFTMLVDNQMTWSERLLVRLQRAEFAKWTDVALRRDRRTSVLAGTACCMRNAALKEVVEGRRRTDSGAGPWIETSMVEDFELTYRLRELGWQTKVSATVRASTDAMRDLRSLWAQRMKWQTGTVNDLLDFGYNPLTRLDWWQQAQGGIAVLVRLTWMALLGVATAAGAVRLQPIWLLPPLLFLANDVKQALRIPHRDTGDIVVAALLLPQELFAFMRAGWFLVAWGRVVDQKTLGISYGDVWARQARAESRRRRPAVQPARYRASATPAENAA